MKLSNETLVVLKNFASINSGIQFKTGNVISTMSGGKTILAKATVKDEFPQDFCVYDLNQFLSIHSIGKDTELDFDDKNIIIKAGKNEISYRKTEKSMIVTPPDKELKLPSSEISFSLSEEELASILKATAILQSPNISVQSDGDTVNIVSCNVEDSSAHTNSFRVGEGNGTSYKMVFLADNLKLIPGSYDVEISSKGLSHFKNKNVDIQYWVATEAKYSKFGE